MDKSVLFDKEYFAMQSKNNKILDKHTELGEWLKERGDCECDVQLSWLEPQVKRAMNFARNEGRKQSVKEELEKQYAETTKTLQNMFLKKETVSMEYVLLIKILEDAHFNHLKELGLRE